MENPKLLNDARTHVYSLGCGVKLRSDCVVCVAGVGYQSGVEEGARGSLAGNSALWVITLGTLGILGALLGSYQGVVLKILHLAFSGVQGLNDSTESSRLWP